MLVAGHPTFQWHRQPPGVVAFHPVHAHASLYFINEGRSAFFFFFEQTDLSHLQQFISLHI